ncbi:MAG: AAA family ATPase [Phycisphaerales bacterium]
MKPDPEHPAVIAIGGPNGAGKTTVSRSVLADALSVDQFVNADTIAAGLSGFNPARAAFSAGRVMLGRLQELAAARERFAFESTLSSRTFAPWLSRLTATGYRVGIVYVWVRSARIAVERVRARVRKGGHTVPEADIRRRYTRSASNLFALYLPLAEASGGPWRIYDNSGSEGARLVAYFDAGVPVVLDQRTFARLREVAREGSPDPEDR